MLNGPVVFIGGVGLGVHTAGICWVLRPRIVYNRGQIGGVQCLYIYSD